MEEVVEEVVDDNCETMILNILSEYRKLKQLVATQEEQIRKLSQKPELTVEECFEHTQEQVDKTVELTVEECFEHTQEHVNKMVELEIEECFEHTVFKQPLKLEMVRGEVVSVEQEVQELSLVIGIPYGVESVMTNVQETQTEVSHSVQETQTEPEEPKVEVPVVKKPEPKTEVPVVKKVVKKTEETVRNCSIKKCQKETTNKKYCDSCTDKIKSGKIKIKKKTKQ